jgi:hypothetical protein
MNEQTPSSLSMSSKRLKFRELAENRTNKALDAVRRIGNLANPQLYEPDQTEVRKIIKALRDAVSDVEAKFASPRARPPGAFKL